MDRGTDIPLLQRGTPQIIIIQTGEKDKLSTVESFVPEKDERRRNGVLNQIILTSAVWLISAACGMPIGFSSVLLPQLVIVSSLQTQLTSNVTAKTTTVIDNQLIGAPATEELLMDMELGSWISSIHSAASPVGSFFAGPFSDRYGRRTSLLVSIVPLIISWVIMAISNSHWLLIVARVLGGMAVGFMAAPSSILVAEIAQPQLRGILTGSPFVAYSLGIMFVFLLGWKLSWRLVAWAGIILPLISWLALFFSHESPTWLVRNQRPEQAFKSMRWLRDTDAMAREEVDELMERFEKEEREERQNKNQSLWRTMSRPEVLKPLVLILLFNTFQIISGALMVVFYTVHIIEEFGGSGKGVDNLTAAVFTAVFRLGISLMYCALLLYMNRRKMINVAGSISTISALALGFLVIFKHNLTASFVSHAAAVLMICYLGGSMCLFIMSGVSMGELLPSAARGKLSSYIFSYMNVVLFLLVKIFPSIISTIKLSGLFFIFAIGSFLATLTIFLMMPETRNQKLADIEDYFKGDNWLWCRRPQSRNTN